MYKQTAKKLLLRYYSAIKNSKTQLLMNVTLPTTRRSAPVRMRSTVTVVFHCLEENAYVTGDEAG
jgi:hypothetical protein